MLSRNAIRLLMRAGLITVTPAPANIGPNSVDLRLGRSMRRYRQAGVMLDSGAPPRLDLAGRLNLRAHDDARYAAIDPRRPPELEPVPPVAADDTGLPPGGVPEGAWLLVPGNLYLGETLERTHCVGLVPHIDGRSTCGRLGIELHRTAGVGDNGYSGRWTLEITVAEPVIVWPGLRLAQVYFTPAWGAGLGEVLALLHGARADGARDSRMRSLVGSARQAAAVLRELVELRDLYGDDGRAHYQDAAEVAPAAPVDDLP